MIKKTIKFEDYNGNVREEDFHFHLTKAEAITLNFSKNTESLRDHVDRIVKANKFSDLVQLFKDIILLSYGEKSEDGRRFIKTKELSEEFSQTEAFSVLFTELATDADAAAKFINGILPQNTDGNPQAPVKGKKVTKGKTN